MTITEACVVWIALYFKRPKSLPKSVLFHTKKPDWDNAVKPILDCLEKTGVVKNDSYFTGGYAYKHYATEENEPGALIRVYPINAKELLDASLPF